MSAIEVHEKTIDYYGHALRVFAVYLDGQLASGDFERFKASSVLISSEICQECYAATGGGIVTCGEPDIVVRRHGDFVYWFLADREWVRPLIPDVALGHVWSFPVESYESQLEGSTANLPDFGSAEVRSILNRARIFPRQLGLYTIPEIEDDPQGRGLLDIIQEVAEAGDWTICEAPESFHAIRIGIETTGVPETIVEVGKVNRECAVRFVANPGFPLWLTSELIRQRFTRFVQ